MLESSKIIFPVPFSEYEASFIRMIDNLSNGNIVEVNDTGTVITFKPGFLIGGKVKHKCPESRSIG